MKLSEAEWLVEDFESSTIERQRKIFSHPKFNVDKKPGPMAYEYFRAKCMTDFWTYFWHYLNFNQRKHYYLPVHGPQGLAGFLQDRTIEKHGERVHVGLRVVVATRYARKTQMCFPYFIWKFIRDTNERVLIRAFNEDKVNEIVLPMVSVIESERHRRMFPWVKPKAKASGVPVLWSPKEGRFLLDREDIVRTPSVEACGMEQDPTGGHFGNGLYDDFEVEKNTNSELMREQMWEKWKNDKPLFGAASDVVLVGTPWHKDGLINAALHGWREFEKLDYGMWILPATYQAFDRTWHGSNAKIGEDRTYVQVGDGHFGTEDLTGVRVKCTFWHPVLKDTVEELRECTGNDATGFRVNRPFPVLLENPKAWYVDNYRCSLPTIHTMDGIDEPPSKKPDVLPRVSLWVKRIEMGSHKYSKQMELDVRDADSMMLDSDLIKRIDQTEVPVTEVNLFRACDFASSGKTSASTAIMDVLHHSTGVYITKIINEPTIKLPAIMLELFMGVIRAEEAKCPVVLHFFEEANIEKAVKDFLPHAESDPYTFFKQMGGEYEQKAELWFKDRGSIYLPKKWLTRGRNREGKAQRIISIQAWLERGQVFIVKDIPNAEALFSQLDEFKIPIPQGQAVDLLDVLTDDITQGYPQRSTEPVKKQNWLQVQHQGRMRRIGNSSGSAMGW